MRREELEKIHELIYLESLFENIIRNATKAKQIAVKQQDGALTDYLQQIEDLARQALPKEHRMKYANNS